MNSLMHKSTREEGTVTTLFYKQGNSDPACITEPVTGGVTWLRVQFSVTEAALHLSIMHPATSIGLNLQRVCQQTVVGTNTMEEGGDRRDYLFSPVV